MDTQVLLDRCMGDGKFAAQTVRKFADRAVREADELCDLIAAGDVRQVKLLAHNLRAVAAHVEAGDLRRIAFEIEEAAARADLEVIAQRAGPLREEVRRCAAYVPEALAILKGAPDRPDRNSEGKA